MIYLKITIVYSVFIKYGHSIKYNELKKSLIGSGKTISETLEYLFHINDMKFLMEEQNISQSASANLLNVDLNLLKAIEDEEVFADTVTIYNGCNIK